MFYYILMIAQKKAIVNVLFGCVGGIREGALNKMIIYQATKGEAYSLSLEEIESD